MLDHKVASGQDQAGFSGTGGAAAAIASSDSGPNQARTLDRITGLIGSMIRDVTAEGQALRTATDTARSLRDRLAVTASEVEAKLYRASTVVPDLEARVARCEALLAAAEDRARAAEERAGAAEARVASAAGRSLGGSPADSSWTPTADAAELVEGAEHAARRADSARELLADAIVGAASRLEELESRRAALADEIDRTAESARAAESSLAGRSAEFARSLDRAMEMPLARLDAQIRGASAGLDELLDRAREADRSSRQGADELARLMADLRDVLAAAEPWRAVLVDHRPGELPAPMAETVALVRDGLRQDLARVGAAVADLAGRLGPLAAELGPAEILPPQRRGSRGASTARTGARRPGARRSARR